MSTASGIPALFMVRELHHGGIERDVAKIAIHMDKSRYIPHVASFNNSGMRYEELMQAGIPFLHVPLKSLISVDAARQALRFRKYIREHGIRVVHAFDSTATFAASAARYLAHTPAVLSSMLGSRDLLDQRTRRWLRMTDGIVDKVVVNCEAMRMHMMEEGVSSDRIAICYNGVDTREFHLSPERTRNEEAVRDASLVIGAICVLRPEKALHLLQEAFAKIRSLDDRMKLLIVGSGPELPRLEANRDRLGLGDSCIFLPATREVSRMLKNIDIFVLCSISEAFSNALLEAMASGCAVVGSRVGGTPELTGSHEERGLLFESGNADDLAARLAVLVRDPLRREQLAGRAAAFASETLSIEQAAARMADIYDEVLRSKS